MSTKKKYLQPTLVSLHLETEEFSQNPLNQGSSPLGVRPGVSLDSQQTTRSTSSVLQEKVSIARNSNMLNGLGDDILQDDIY